MIWNLMSQSILDGVVRSMVPKYEKGLRMTVKNLDIYVLCREM